MLAVAWSHAGGSKKGSSRAGTGGEWVQAGDQ